MGTIVYLGNPATALASPALGPDPILTGNDVSMAPMMTATVNNWGFDWFPNFLLRPSFAMTIYSALPGDWNDQTIWYFNNLPVNRVPNINDNVAIQTKVTWRAGYTVAANFLGILDWNNGTGGALIADFGFGSALNMSVWTLMLYPGFTQSVGPFNNNQLYTKRSFGVGGLLQITGSTAPLNTTPMTAGQTATLTFRNRDRGTGALLSSPQDPNFHAGGFLNHGGMFIANSAQKTPIVQVGGARPGGPEPQANDTTLYFQSPVNGWQVNDNLHLPDSTFPTAPAGPSPVLPDDVQVKTAPGNGATQCDIKGGLGVGGGLRQAHPGGFDANNTLVTKCLDYVANTSRNIKFISSGGATNLGRPVFLWTGFAYMDCGKDGGISVDGFGWTSGSNLNGTKFASTPDPSLIPPNNYGVVNFRTVQVNDGNISAGSSTVTSATANFTAADIGANIRVWGVKGGGAPLIDTIGSVTPNSATFATPGVGAEITGTNVRVDISGYALNQRGRYAPHSHHCEGRESQLVPGCLIPLIFDNFVDANGTNLVTHRLDQGVRGRAYLMTLTSGSTSVTVTSTANLQAGMVVYNGYGVPLNTTIASINSGTTFTLSAPVSFILNIGNGSYWGSVYTGWAVANGVGPWTIQSNQAQCVVAGNDEAILADTSSQCQPGGTYDNVTISVKLPTAATNGASHRLIFRASADGTTYYFASREGTDANNAYLYYHSAGTNNLLATFPHVWANNDVLSVDLRGNTMTVNVNGVALGNYTIATNYTAYKFGIGASIAGTATFSSWSVKAGAIFRFANSVILNSTNYSTSGIFDPGCGKWGLTIHMTGFGYFDSNIIGYAAGAGVAVEGEGEYGNWIGNNYQYQCRGSGLRFATGSNGPGTNANGYWLSSYMCFIQNNLGTNNYGAITSGDSGGGGLGGDTAETFLLWLGFAGSMTDGIPTSITVPQYPGQQMSQWPGVLNMANNFNPNAVGALHGFFRNNKAWACLSCYGQWQHGYKSIIDNDRFNTGTDEGRHENNIGWNFPPGSFLNFSYEAWNFTYDSMEMYSPQGWTSGNGSGMGVHTSDYTQGLVKYTNCKFHGIQATENPSTDPTQGNTYTFDNCTFGCDVNLFLQENNSRALNTTDYPVRYVVRNPTVIVPYYNQPTGNPVLIKYGDFDPNNPTAVRPAWIDPTYAAGGTFFNILQPLDCTIINWLGHNWNSYENVQTPGAITYSDGSHNVPNTSPPNTSTGATIGKGAPAGAGVTPTNQALFLFNGTCINGTLMPGGAVVVTWINGGKAVQL